jgi:hypothetical protein
MSLYGRASGIASVVRALAPELAFGPVEQNINSERQKRKKKLKHLGLKSMRQFRLWEKKQRKIKK